MNKNVLTLFATVMAFGICIACFTVYAGGDQQRIRVFGPGFDDSTTATPTDKSQRFNFSDTDGDGICDAIHQFQKNRQSKNQGNNGNQNNAHNQGNNKNNQGNNGQNQGKSGQNQGNNGEDQGKYKHQNPPGQLKHEHGFPGNPDPGHGARLGTYGPPLAEGQVLLTGAVTEVDGDLITIINGAFVIDVSAADIQFMHWFHPPESEQEVIEVGQRVALLGTVEITDDGTLINAICVRVMDPIHCADDEAQGSIRGHIDSFDYETGALLLTGIPILMSDETRILPAVVDIDSIEPGVQAVARVLLVDTDDDELVDALLATKINVYMRR